MAPRATEAPVGARPVVDEGKHPVESTRYSVPTPQVEEMCAQVIQWIHLRVPGGLIYGPPRYGKTVWLKFLCGDLDQAFHGMPILLFPAWDYTFPREKSFLSDLLTAAGHVLNKTGSAEQMRDRLVAFLAEQGKQSGDGRVLLIIDEAQNLHPKHYNWLIGIHNMLSLLGVNLIVLLVGQKELLTQRTAFIRAEKKQIVGRFMTHAQEFHGVQSESDLHEIMKAYDELTEYPEQSKWSFTRYYAPESFGNGWRLAQLSFDFWSAFRTVRTIAIRGHREDLPMQYVCRTIDHFLTHVVDRQLADQEAVRKLVLESIAASGYRDTLLVS
jgi:hypothetical protein